MPYAFEHVHLKAPDPAKTAQWYVEAFDFEIFSDKIAGNGSHMIECKTTDGGIVRISGPKPDEVMGQGDANPHYGIEHFGLIVDDMNAEITRLEKLGAKLLDGPMGGGQGPTIAFIQAPDDVRIEILQMP